MAKSEPKGKFDTWKEEMGTFTSAVTAFQKLYTEEAQGAIEFAEGFAQSVGGGLIETSDRFKVGNYLEGRVIPVAKKTALGYFDENKVEVLAQARKEKEGDLVKKVLQTPVVKTGDEGRDKIAELHGKYQKLSQILSGYSDNRANQESVRGAVVNEVVEEVAKTLGQNKYLDKKDIEIAQAAVARQVTDRTAYLWLQRTLQRTKKEFDSMFRDEKAKADYAIDNIRLAYEEGKKQNKEEIQLGALQILESI